MAVLTLPADITVTGLDQKTLHTFLTNVATVVNELVDDHATNKTTIDESKTAIDELIDDHDTNQTHLSNIKTLLNRLRTDSLTKCVTPPNFEIDTNFDIQNGDAFEIMSAGVLKTVATDVNFDTGTSTIVTTNAFWAGGILSVDIDGTTTAVDWGAESSSEAGAITNLASVTASNDVIAGYVTVHAKAGEDFVGGTDALTTGTGGQVAQATNYYNISNIGDAAIGAAVTTSEESALSAGDPTASAATLTNSTDLTLLKG